MKIGYAHVSTLEQNLDLQRDALTEAGCEKVFVDTISGSVAARPGLEKVKEQLRAGDTLVVWRLDRLGRSLKDLTAWVGYLEEQQAGLWSLHEAIDTATPAGKLMFHLFGAIAEFERNLVRERTQAGLTAARSRPGAARARSRQAGIGGQALPRKTLSIARICTMMGISKPTLYAYVKAAQQTTA
ncbi:DNA-invertase [Salinisphaera sp. LB1]|nr:recombinase family protein [Salinisphaera sp. LB1]AWN17962.1 DNA-invertase [Salinisphaera sp. LB1]